MELSQSLYGQAFQVFSMKLAAVSCLLYPVFAAVAFALHPNLLSLSMHMSTDDRISEFHHNGLMHFGHFLLVLAIPMLMVAGIHLAGIAFNGRPVLSAVGLVFLVLGCFILAMDKAALCFVPSALDSLPEKDFANAWAGIDAVFSLKGYLKVLHLLPLLPLGFVLIAIALIQTQVIPLYQSIPMLIGALLMINPDIDLISLAGSLVIGAGFIPYGISLLKI